jgi:glyceraldehyde 3-phosphate dehydrogenase
MSGRKFFGEIVVNLGRPAGGSLADVAHYVERDSTYGRLQAYLYGHRAQPVITDIDETLGRMLIDGVPVTFLRAQRNPAGSAGASTGCGLWWTPPGAFSTPPLSAGRPQGVAARPPGLRCRKGGGVGPVQGQGQNRRPCRLMRSPPSWG